MKNNKFFRSIFLGLLISTGCNLNKKLKMKDNAIRILEQLIKKIEPKKKFVQSKLYLKLPKLFKSEKWEGKNS